MPTQAVSPSTASAITSIESGTLTRAGHRAGRGVDGPQLGRAGAPEQTVAGQERNPTTHVERRPLPGVRVEPEQLRGVARHPDVAAGEDHVVVGVEVQRHRVATRHLTDRGVDGDDPTTAVERPDEAGALGQVAAQVAHLDGVSDRRGRGVDLVEAPGVAVGAPPRVPTDRAAAVAATGYVDSGDEGVGRRVDPAPSSRCRS